MRKKFVKTLGFTLIALLALSVLNSFLVFRVKANPTTVEVINPLDGSHDFFFTSDTMPVGSVFIINITVFDVTDLVCWEIKLSWDPSLLDFYKFWLPSDHVFKGVEAVGGNLVIPPPIIEPGSVICGAAFIMPPEHWSFNGTGTMCQLALRITQGVSPGNPEVYCDLQFADIPMNTFLFDSLWTDIPFTPVNGNYRYRYVPEAPHGPSAHFFYNPTKPQPNDIITFDGTSSTPGWDGSNEMPIVSYEWDFNSDGVVDAQGPIVDTSYPAPGNYQVTLNVTDSQGLWDTETQPITVVSLGLVIENGVVWLASQQNPDGSWGWWCPVAQTALAVLKLEEHAVDPKYGYGLPSPFDPAYPFRENVEKGLNYIFAHAYIVNIGLQPAGNPDTNGNGVGIYFSSWNYEKNYQTSTAMMAIAGSRSPSRVVNVPGSSVDGWTYKDVLQDAVDYLAWGQTDWGYGRGGWNYDEMINGGDRSDQSNSGWAVFGLASAESPNYQFECTVPEFVKTELITWIDYIQNDVDGDIYDGGAGYSDPSWPNILRTGHLLYMMAFVGYTSETPRVQDAVDYLVRWWNDPTIDPGWKGYPGEVSGYHAMFNVMKGLVGLGIHEIDGIDWQTEFDHVLMTQQLNDGSWPTTYWDSGGDRILSTSWALLTLEKVVPIPGPHGPVAYFTFDPKRPQVNDIVTFDASLSIPGWDGTHEMPIVSYEWDFETDGIVDAYGITATHAYPAAGTYLVTLKVTDSQGSFDTTTRSIKVVTLGQVIKDGVAWLVNQQKPDGSWGASYPVAETGLAVLKLEEHAVDSKYGYGLASPFDPSYPYHENVERGLNYLFSKAKLIDIFMQPAGDPDTNHNGKGVYFTSWEWDRWYSTYETGIAMMAIAGSRSPGRVVSVLGSSVDGWTYKDVLQDAVDYLAFGQNDADWPRGGWGYYDNIAYHSDQSNSGWAVFGLGFAESPAYKFMCTVPAFVKTELNIWIDYIQNDVDGDIYDGGAGYSEPSWPNILRTGHLLYMMAFVGDTAATPRVMDAVHYLVRWWNDPTTDPGWRGTPGQIASYQAMFNVMKGLFTLGIHEIDGIDWQTEFEHVLKAQQLEDGSWPNTLYDWTPERILSTTWALLTLEKVAPPPIMVSKWFTDSDNNPLPTDANGNAMVTVVLVPSSTIQNCIVASTNPGQVLAWVNITNLEIAEIKSLTIKETLPLNWEAFPSWDPAMGAIHIYFVSGGVTTEITQWTTIQSTPGSPGKITVSISDIEAAAGKPMRPGDSILVSVKMQYSLKGTAQSPNIYPITYTNHVETTAYDEPNYQGLVAEAEESESFVAYAKRTSLKVRDRAIEIWY